MAGDWATLPLGEVAAVRSGYAFKSSDWTESGVPVVKIANVKGGRLEMAGCSFVDEAVANGAGDFRLSDGDILIAMTGYVGDVARVRKTDLPCVLNQRVGKFTVLNSERLDASYLFLFLASVDTRQTIAGIGYGSAQPNVSPSLIHKVEIPLPPLPEQKRIAHILGTLDDKIELNRRMNATLEGISRAIFKSWFVDFDPVRQKAAGQQPVGMDAQTAELFPDGFEDSEIGEVPRGWTVGVVGDSYDITMGQSPPGDTYNESGDGVPFFQGRADFSFRYPERRVFCTAPNRFASPGDTLVSVRAPVGDLNMALERCAIGRGVAAVRHKTGAIGFTYYGMHALSTSFEKFEGEGTVFGSMGKKEFHGIKAVAPLEAVIRVFERVVGPQDKQIEILERQTSILGALRDTLLPKLLSGEVRIPEAEVAIEEVLA